MTAPSETLHAFDRHAEGYAGGWGSHPLARCLRARVLALCARYFPPNGRVLDLGCGPGLDAEALEALGHHVTAIDASAGMVAEARRRAADARRMDLGDLGALLAEGPFDGALSDFGALNCLPRLDGFARDLPRLLRPGAFAVLVVINRACLAEDLALLARARRPRRAWLRKGVSSVSLEGVELPIRYLSARDVIAALPGFDVVRREALGALMAPPDLGGRPGLRTRLEPFVATLPVLRDLGDHSIVVLRRNATSVPG